MKKLWQKFEKLLGFYRWHPKIALRYLPVVRDIRKNFSGNYSILEVGSGNLGIAPYLKHQVIGIDINFSYPYHPGLIPVIAKAEDIPFANNSFSIVCCVDMLEHIPKSHRSVVIKELIRIAEKKVYIGVPCGNLSEAQDEELMRLYKKIRTADDKFLSEQVDYGLPIEQEISDTIKQTATKLKKQVDIKITGNINLKIRKFLMKGWISENFIINLIFRKLFLIFIPIMRHMNREPTYRKLFFADIKL